MRRVRLEKPRPRRERTWREVLPLDPRDPDVVRAKAIDRSGDRQMDVTRN
jgi:hypothetical protein